MRKSVVGRAMTPGVLAKWERERRMRKGKRG